MLPQVQRRQWAMHLRTPEQRLKDNLKTDGIKLWLFSPISYSPTHSIFYPFTDTRSWNLLAGLLWRKVTRGVAPGPALKLTLLSIIQEKWKENKARNFCGTEFLENNLSGSLGSKHKSWFAWRPYLWYWYAEFNILNSVFKVLHEGNLKSAKPVYRMVGSQLVSIVQALSTQALEYTSRFYENVYSFLTMWQ